MSIEAGMSRALFPGLVLAVALASSARAEPGSLPQTAAACQAVSTVEPPATDKPTQAQMQSLEGCDAEALFYGIGRPADPAQARLCAFPNWVGMMQTRQWASPAGTC
ncbi:hypothetical protein [Aureimonas frigidaquae]|uniref:hypothetical protein n=1 Tax=Aureimonas frigidaquae TaxID=424757 RepID=UPI0007806D81|nr:hypothetical protein [Aureimonas frigidaquae]